MKIILDAKHYVYHHICNGKIFYVGLGKGGRAFETKHRTEAWANYIEDNGGEYEVVIVKRYVNRKRAAAYEKQQIYLHEPCINREFRYHEISPKGIESHARKNFLFRKEYAKLAGELSKV